MRADVKAQGEGPAPGMCLNIPALLLQDLNGRGESSGNWKLQIHRF